MNTTTQSKETNNLLIIAGIAAAFAISLFPALSHAATFAYVNTSGEVSMVTASAPMTAIATAPGIAVHSGVLLIVNPADTSITTVGVTGV